MVVIIKDFLSINTYASRNNMNMCAVNICMLENNIGLISVAHTFHIFLRHICKLLVTYLIRRIWVQRYMPNGFFCFDIGRQIGFKTFIEILSGIFSVNSVGNFVQQQNCALFGFYFLLIVQNRTVHI